MIQFYRKYEWSVFYHDDPWRGENHTHNTAQVEYVPHESTNAANFDMHRGVQRIGTYRGGFMTPSAAGK